MRPNTSSSGILSTKRNRPVSTSMLTRMLVPKPKKAFQSPGTQSLGLNVDVIDRLPSSTLAASTLANCLNDGGRAGDPAEDAALRLDHFQSHLLELGEVRADAILQHEAVVAAVVGLADSGVHADL